MRGAAKLTFYNTPYDASGLDWTLRIMKPIFSMNEGLSACAWATNLLQHTPYDASGLDGTFRIMKSIVSMKVRVRIRTVNLIQHTLRRHQTRRDLSNYEIYRSFQ